jgi:deoxycytidylate deaminase
MDLKFYKTAIDERFDIIKQEAEKNQICLRKACGCAILTFLEDGTIFSTQAINGPSHPNNKCTNEIGNCGCSHAEPRAILKHLRTCCEEDRPTILLTTYSSCISCANLIIEAGFIDIIAYEIWAPHWAKADSILRSVLEVWTRNEITEELLRKFFDDYLTR